MRHIGWKVVAAHLHNFGILAGKLFALQNRLGNTDDLSFPVGLPGDGGKRHKCDDRRQNQGQNAEDESVVQFHKHLSCHRNSSASVAAEQPQARKGKNGIAMGCLSRKSRRNSSTTGMAKPAATRNTSTMPEGP